MLSLYRPDDHHNRDLYPTQCAILPSVEITWACHSNPAFPLFRRSAPRLWPPPLATLRASICCLCPTKVGRNLFISRRLYRNIDVRYLGICFARQSTFIDDAPSNGLPLTRRCRPRLRTSLTTRRRLRLIVSLHARTISNSLHPLFSIFVGR